MHYDALSPASAASLAKLAMRAGSGALKALNRHAMRFERANAKQAGARQRINFGVYFYSEPAP